MLHIHFNIDLSSGNFLKYPFRDGYVELRND